MRPRNVFALLLPIVFVVWSSTPAHADLLAPGDVLRVSFNMNQYDAPPPMSAIDVLQFITGLTPLQPVGSYTTRVIDRGQVLGTYTAAFNPNTRNGSYFRAPGSIFTFGNPTVMDFSSFRNGTFDGSVEFSISSGLVNWGRVSEGLVLGVAISPSDFVNTGFVYPDQNASWAIIHPTPTATPEPGTLLLLGTAGAAWLARRSRGRASS